MNKSGIHIKKSHEGRFTTKAQAAGKSVQEYAREVMANPNADPATRKQANFARNAAKWHKKKLRPEGGQGLRQERMGSK